jgi:hypothetical protein
LSSATVSITGASSRNGANMPHALGLTGPMADGWVSPLVNFKPPREAARGNLAIDRATRASGRNPRGILRIEDVAPNVLERVAEQRASSPERPGA